MNDWLRRAAAHQRSGTVRTYVTCRGGAVVGYYALAAAAVARTEATGRVARNAPDPIPAILLARLAVDISVQGRGLGADLLRDALLRCLQAADIIGVRAVLVHALNDRVVDFYTRHGFRPSPISPLTLMVTMEQLRASL